jgi:plastocyanin
MTWIYRNKILYFILPMILVLGIYGSQTSYEKSGYFQPYGIKKSNDIMIISIDNPTYKQGQTINILGHVNHYTQGVSISLRMIDPAKNIVGNFHILVDRFGIFTGSFVIPDTFPSDKYVLNAYYEGDLKKILQSFVINISDTPTEVHILIPFGASSEANKLNFVPSKVVVPHGTKVVWINNDGTVHTVISGKVNDNGTLSLDSLFNGGYVTPGGKLVISPKPGNYTYFCKLHPWLGGDISVKPIKIPAKPAAVPAKPTPVPAKTATVPAKTATVPAKPTSFTHDPTLLSYWTFDDELLVTKDQGVLGKDLIQVGKGKIVSGHIRNAFNFTGINYFKASSPSFYNFTTSTPFSIAFWVKIPSKSVPVDFVSKTSANHGPGWHIWSYSKGKLLFTIGDGKNISEVSSTVSIENNSWQHIVCTYDGSKNQHGMKIYVNGTKNDQGIKKDIAYSISNNQFLSIGASVNGIQSVPVGTLIDDLRIYNVELSEQQISNLFLHP